MKKFRLYHMKKPVLMLFLLLILSTTTISALLTVLTPVVMAQVVKVSLDPPLNSKNTGENFTLNINITDVTDLYSWDLEIEWKAGILTCIDAEEGPFLMQGGSTFFTWNPHTSSVDLGCTLSGVVPGVSDSGVLANATFQVADTGNCTLNLNEVTLLDSDLFIIDDWYEKDSPYDSYFYTSFPKAKPVKDSPYNNYFYTPNPYQVGHPIAGETLTFNASACYDPDDPYDPTPGGIVSYQWDFGDETVVTENDPITTHVYATNDTYTGNLTITDDDGETDTEIFTVEVKLHDLAVINVTATPAEVKVGEMVSINVTVLNEGSEAEYLNVTVYYDGNPIETKLFQYIWFDQWGNPSLRTALPNGENQTMTWGTTSTFQHLVWNTTGVTPGIYTISAEAFLVDQANISRTLPGIELDLADNTFTNGQVAAGDHDIAVTNVTCSPTDVIIGDPVSINVTVTNYGDFLDTFDVTTYYDGVPIQTQSGISLDAKASKNLTFTWDTTIVGEGIYTVKAEASVVQGETDVANNTYVDGDVNVTRPLGVPVANFTYSPENPMVNEEVTFNSTSYDEDGNIVSWKWDFNNDGIIDAVTENATWTYTEAKTFTVTLTVTDNDNLNGTIQKVIAVYAPPTASFTYTPEKPIVNQIVTFDASASTPNGGTIISYEWDFDYDGTTFTVDATGVEANHTYAAFGTYTVMLRVTDSEGLSDSTSEAIKIHVHPVANFTYSPSTNIMTKQTITFNATESYDPDGSIESYEWDFGDGTTKIYVGANLTAIATHVYKLTGLGVHVTLKVTDDDGLVSEEYDVSMPRIYPARDIAVTNITLSSNVVVIGENLSITVTVENYGDVPETFYVTAFYDGNTIGKTPDSSVSVGAEKELTISWNTSDADPGIYAIKAVATSLPGIGQSKLELNATNNQLTSGPVTVRATSTISVFAQPSNITLDESTTINGIISPTRTDVDVTIDYRQSGETSWNTIGTVKTDATSSYEHVWTPTTPGSYELRVSWLGDEITLTASSTTTLTVNKISSTITLDVSPTSVTVGSNITISGSITPARPQVNVEIQYKPSDGTWGTLATVTTDVNGQYSWDWTPQDTGTYEVKASWSGDGNTLADESDVKTVNVQGAFPLDIIIYVLVGVGIVIVAGVAFYFLKIRKPKP